MASIAAVAFLSNAFCASNSAIAEDEPNVEGLPPKFGAAIFVLPNTANKPADNSPRSVVLTATIGSLMGTDPPELNEAIAAFIFATAEGDNPVEARADKVAPPALSTPSPVVNDAGAPSLDSNPDADPRAPLTADRPLVTELVALPIAPDIADVPGILLSAPFALSTTDDIAPSPPGSEFTPLEAPAIVADTLEVTLLTAPEIADPLGKAEVDSGNPGNDATPGIDPNTPDIGAKEGKLGILLVAPTSAAVVSAIFFFAIAVRSCGTPAFNALKEDVIAPNAAPDTPLAVSTNPAMPGIAGIVGKVGRLGNDFNNEETLPNAPVVAPNAAVAELAAPTAPAIDPSPPVAVVARFPAKFPAAIADDADPINELTVLPITAPF